MKKLFLTLLMCVSVFTVSAQLKTVDLRVGVRNTFGIGGGITIVFHRKWIHILC